MSPMKKVGRPKSENPLVHDLKVRFSTAEVERVDAYCKRHGTKRATLIRKATLDVVDADKK